MKAVLTALLITVLHGTAGAQCAFLTRTSTRVEILQTVQVGASSRTNLILVRTLAGPSLKLTIPATALTLVVEGRRIQLPAPHGDGHPMSMDDLMQLRVRDLDTILVHRPEGDLVMPLNDRTSKTALQVAAGCALDAVLTGGELPPVPPAADELRQSDPSPGLLIAQGGREVAIGAGIAILGSIACYALAGNAETDPSVPVYVSAGIGLASLILLLDGGSKLSKGGQLLHERDMRSRPH